MGFAVFPVCVLCGFSLLVFFLLCIRQRSCVCLSVMFVVTRLGKYELGWGKTDIWYGIVEGFI